MNKFILKIIKFLILIVLYTFSFWIIKFLYDQYQYRRFPLESFPESITMLFIPLFIIKMAIVSILMGIKAPIKNIHTAFIRSIPSVFIITSVVQMRGLNTHASTVIMVMLMVLIITFIISVAEAALVRFYLTDQKFSKQFYISFFANIAIVIIGIPIFLLLLKFRPIYNPPTLFLDTNPPQYIYIPDPLN